jgi:anaerobic magnesium-protoporphyrin IX monomethyl ester cyclase
MKKLKKIKKAYLINPPSGLYVREDRCQFPVKGLNATAIRPPIDLAYIASTLQLADVECRIRDFPAEGGNFDNFKKEMTDFVPDLLIISVTSPTIELDMKACKIAKELDPDIITAAKGAHFSVLDVDSLERFPQLDFVIQRETEFIFKEIVEKGELDSIAGITYRKNGEIIKAKTRPFLKDLDSLPFPDRSLIRNELYVRPDTQCMQTTIQTNAGCPSQCVFCLAQRVSGAKVRSRSPKNIITEIHECIDKYKINNFFFRADTFTINKKIAIGLCKEILERMMDINWVCNGRVDTLDAEILAWMAKAGCWLMSIGVESGSPEILKHMKKGTNLDQTRKAIRLCREAGIKTYMLFVMGLPWETKETLRETIDFAKEIDGDFLEFSLAVPFPGTEFYEIALKEGLFKLEDLNNFDNMKPIVNTFSLSKEELLAMRDKGLREFYLRPRYIVRTLKDAKSPQVLMNYLKFGIERLKRLILK